MAKSLSDDLRTSKGTYACQCVEQIHLTSDVRLFRFQLLASSTIEYTSGQFVRVLIPAYAKGSEQVWRNYSIASDPKIPGVVDFIIRRVPGGIGTTYMFDHLKVANILQFSGPFGRFALSDTDAHIIFIAGGSGMSAIRSILFDMLNKKCRRRTVFYFGVNKAEELYLLDEMKMFESQLCDFKFIPVVAAPDDSWQGQAGLVTDAVRLFEKNAPDSEAYLCGGPGMVDTAIELLKQLSMKEDHIFYDKFTSQTKPK